MQAAETVSFGGGGLNRDAHRRNAVQDFASDPASRVLPLWRGRPLVIGEHSPRLLTLPPDHPALTSISGESVFLGSAAGVDHFACDISRWDPPTEAATDSAPGRPGQDQPATGLPNLDKTARFADLRELITSLSPLEGELAATARGILEWHRSHGFCAKCGAKTDSTEGGWQRRCPSCEARHFPRTDPVVIMLVTRGNTLLMGRGKGWPDGFYSLLAGFMEPGETIAAAVRREVQEEAGIATGAVRILASQPWPFPASLMIGCQVEATSHEIHVDPVEMEDVVWVSREEALEIVAGQHSFIAPPRRGAIAQFLFNMWLADRID